MTCLDTTTCHPSGAAPEDAGSSGFPFGLTRGRPSPRALWQGRENVVGSSHPGKSAEDSCSPSLEKPWNVIETSLKNKKKKKNLFTAHPGRPFSRGQECGTSEAACFSQCPWSSDPPGALLAGAHIATQPACGRGRVRIRG